jgi:hypothetical protein
MTKYPYTNRPEDVTKLLQRLKNNEPPAGKIGSSYLKSMGFSTTSGSYLLDILKKLGFMDAENQPTASWRDYAASDSRGLVLAAALKNTYPELFKSMLCPYLEGDESLIEFFEREEPETTPRERGLVVMTFRALSEPADFQDLMCPDEGSRPMQAAPEQSAPMVKVDPRIQLNIQIHIDPATPDAKIEAIFRNMQKYLLGKPQ